MATERPGVKEKSADLQGLLSNGRCELSHVRRVLMPTGRARLPSRRPGSGVAWRTGARTRLPHRGCEMSRSNRACLRLARSPRRSADRQTTQRPSRARLALRQAAATCGDRELREHACAFRHSANLKSLSSPRPMDALERLTPEQRARVRIDAMLETAGW